MVFHVIAEDVVQHGAFGVQLGFQAVGVIQRQAVAVAQDVGREPPLHIQRAGPEGGGQHGLDKGLAGLAILAGHRHASILGKPGQGGDIGGQARREVAVGYALHDRGVGVEHRRADRRIVGIEAALEGCGRLQHLQRQIGPTLDGGQVDHHQIGDAGIAAILADIATDLLHRGAMPALQSVGTVDVATIVTAAGGRPGTHGA